MPEEGGEAARVQFHVVQHFTAATGTITHQLRRETVATATRITPGKTWVSGVLQATRLALNQTSVHHAWPARRPLSAQLRAEAASFAAQGEVQLSSHGPDPLLHLVVLTRASEAEAEVETDELDDEEESEEGRELPDQQGFDGEQPQEPSGTDDPHLRDAIDGAVQAVVQRVRDSGAAVFVSMFVPEQDAQAANMLGHPEDNNAYSDSRSFNPALTLAALTRANRANSLQAQMLKLVSVKLRVAGFCVCALCHL